MIKKERFLALTISLIVCLVFFSGCNENTNNPKTLYVDDDGGADFTSIQSAINAAEPGDTIFVFNGFYIECLLLDKPINLIGSGAANTFILPKNIESNKYCTIFINADNCIVKDFDISLEGEKNENSGIRISSSNNYILNNTFSNFKYGIYFFSDYPDYVLLGNNISYNRISDCTYGLYDYSTDMKNNVIFNNSINNNQNGIELHTAVNCSIISNEVFYNLMYGILLTADSNGNIISYNYLKDNYYGIRFKGVSFNEIFANKIVENDIGLYSCCGSKYNTLYYNSLINNSKQASDAFSDSWDNGEFGNYWEDYNIRYPNATNVNGIWNTPYEILDGLNKDNFPLVNPFV